MKKTNLLSTLVAALFCVAIFTQCGETKKAADDAGKVVSDAGKDMKEGAEKVANDIKEGAEDTKEAVKEGLDKMDSKAGELSFEAGTWEAKVYDGFSSGSSTVFTLDQVPYEGEEISDAGKAQLDNLAAILKANPDWSIEVQGHTPSPYKKLANGFGRAKWVQLKMNARGITGKQISAKGYGDEKLLSGVAPEDDSHKRITIALSK